MKDFIEKSGLTASQFAKKYDIPYNTVRQWAEGIRKAPAWVKRLFEAEQAYKPLILKNEKNTFYEYYNDEDLVYRAFLPTNANEDQIDWFNKKQEEYQHETNLNRKKIYKYHLILEVKK